MLNLDDKKISAKGGLVYIVANTAVAYLVASSYKAGSEQISFLEALTSEESIHCAAFAAIILSGINLTRRLSDYVGDRLGY